MTDNEAKSIYWLLSQMLGRPVAQKWCDGRMLYSVTDLGQPSGNGVRRISLMKNKASIRITRIIFARLTLLAFSVFSLNEWWFKPRGEYENSAGKNGN